MKLAVLKETAEAERRVAATPETVKKFVALGAEVAVEAGTPVPVKFRERLRAKGPSVDAEPPSYRLAS